MTTETLPPAIARNIASFKACHPDLPHRLFDKHAIRRFLSGSMDKEVLWAFDELLPHAYKTDLARLCLLYEFGGVYADLSVCFHGSWNVIPGKLAVFRDRAVIAPWIVSNTIIAAPPRFPAIEAAIRMILANCRTRHRGASPLCPTGPVLFGKAIATHCSPDQIHLGEVTNVAARDSTESLVFVDATDGRMIGYRTKTRAGLAELGLHHGVNNYNDFHRSGVIYANDFPVTIAAGYLYRSSLTACSFENGELVYRRAHSADDAEARLAVGNLPPFTAGSYTVLLDVSAASAGAVLTLFVTSAGNGVEWSRTTQSIERDGPATLSVHFDLPASRNDITIGVLIGNSGFLSLKQLRVLRTAADEASCLEADLPGDDGNPRPARVPAYADG